MTFEFVPAFAFNLAVRARRLEIRLYQEALAYAALVERAHMGKIERGEHIPNLVLIFRLVSALAIAPGELVDHAAKLVRNG